MSEPLIGLLVEAGRLLAALMLATFPAAVLYWLLIHPLARLWRRLGPVVAYTTVTIVCLATAYLIFRYRQPLLASRWPFSWWLVGIGGALYLPSVWLEIQCRRHLKLSTLVGGPELGRDPGKVLSGGIYARMRHPRYLAIILGVTAWACWLNYPAIWALAVAMVPAFYLVILLEERELVDRFGEEYESYRRAVPNRLIPRLRQRS